MLRYLQQNTTETSILRSPEGFAIFPFLGNRLYLLGSLLKSKSYVVLRIHVQGPTGCPG